MLLIIIISCFLVSLALTWVVRAWATKKAILDLPNDRSSHTIPTPRGGGIAIALIWFVIVFCYGVIYDNIPAALWKALLCGLPITIIGLIDDIVNLPQRIRLLIHLVCASMAVYFLGGLQSVDIGFAVINGNIFLSIAAILGIAWFINLFNFLDGIDGYISMEVIFICLASFLLFGLNLPLLLAAATAGFLVWNWQPAKIFMGDIGSTLLGFNIGVFAVYFQNSGHSSIMIWLMLSSVFWMDATLTLFWRWKNKEELAHAHRKHAYQRIVQWGFSHRKTVISALLINILIFGMSWISLLFPVFLLPLFGVVIILVFIAIKMVNRRFPFSVNQK